jgi:hypothetical protein
VTFNPNAPQATDPILQSFFQLRANFQTIGSSFAENHALMDRNVKNNGKHTTLSLQNVSDPVTAATQISIYNKAVATIPELFFRPSSNQTPIQMTYPSIDTDNATDQYSFVAGPFVVYFGRLTDPTDGQIVTLLPATTLIYVDVTVTNSRIKLSLAVSAIDIATNIVGNSFTIRFATRQVTDKSDAFYVAIGV